MSLFLGKIHYWLFNKILWFEGLEDEIIKLAEKKGMDVEQISHEIILKYGEKLQGNKLEDIIEQNNIHGWLENKIQCAEGRMASWVSYLMKNNENNLSQLEEIYILQGLKAANHVKESKTPSSAKEIYNSINDYILDGMPCDRVNEITVFEEDNVQWKRQICVRKTIWEKENVQVDIFYNLRGLWIKAFVEALSNNFEYVENNNSEYSIIRKK